MHIEVFDIHALEGAIHIDISISFMAVSAICIDKTPSIRIKRDDMLMSDVAICVELSIHGSIIFSKCFAWIIWSLAQGAIYIGILKENISIYCLYCPRCKQKMG